MKQMLKNVKTWKENVKNVFLIYDEKREYDKRGVNPGRCS